MSKVCATCKKDLPFSSFKTYKKSYYNCRDCEKIRVAEYKRKVKAIKELEKLHEYITQCDACEKIQKSTQLVKYGKERKVCVACKKKFVRHADPHNAIMDNDCCLLCSTYGESKNCVRNNSKRYVF